MAYSVAQRAEERLREVIRASRSAGDVRVDVSDPNAGELLKEQIPEVPCCGRGAPLEKNGHFRRHGMEEPELASK